MAAVRKPRRTMDPLSITAGFVGIAASALHGVRLLHNLQSIVDAPDAIKSLGDNLLSVDQALTSIQAVSDRQWKSLGETIVGQLNTAITSCKESCDKFRIALGRWTQRSNDGKLFWQDRVMVGVFKQGHIKSMLEPVRNCKITLTSVVSIANL